MLSGVSDMVAMWPLEFSALQVLMSTMLREAEKMGSSSTLKGEQTLEETVFTPEWEDTLVVAGAKPFLSSSHLWKPFRMCFITCLSPTKPVSVSGLWSDEHMKSDELLVSGTQRVEHVWGEVPPPFSETKAWVCSRRLGCGPCLPGPFTTAAQAQVPSTFPLSWDRALDVAKDKAEAIIALLLLYKN